MLPICAVTNDKCVWIEMFFRFEQSFRRDDHHVRASKQIVLDFLQPARSSRKCGVFIDAVIDYLALAQSPGDHSGGRIENHVHDILKPKPPHCFSDLSGEESLIDAADYIISI